MSAGLGDRLKQKYAGYSTDMRRRLIAQTFSGGPWDGRHFERWEPCEKAFAVGGGRYVLVAQEPSSEPIAQGTARYVWTNSPDG